VRDFWLGSLTLALVACGAACDGAPSAPVTPDPPAAGMQADGELPRQPAPPKPSATSAPAKTSAPAAPAEAGRKAAAITGDPRKVMTAAGTGNLDVEARLRVADIQAATGNKAEFVPALLQGIKPSPSYGRARFAPKDRAHYGVGLQVWTAKDLADAKARLALHRKTYRGAATSKAVGREALTAKQHTILHLSWIRGDASEVITLTCDERLCTAQQLAMLARLVDRR
jgi:hypothetical protein